MQIVQATAEGKQELAHALAEQEAARITSKGSGEDRNKALVEQLERYQRRILELEEHAARRTQESTESPVDTGGLSIRCLVFSLVDPFRFRAYKALLAKIDSVPNLFAHQRCPCGHAVL